MIIGIGTDLIEIERFEKINIQNFIKRYFTANEISLFADRKNRISVIAGNFAVKEAASKCLGTGVRKFELKDMEVLRDELGKPYIILYDKCLEISNELGISSWHVSISNTDKYVNAVVLAQSNL